MVIKPIGNYVTLSQGLAINKGSAHLVSDTKKGKFILPLLRIADMMGNKYSKYISTDVTQNVIANTNDIIYTRTGQIGLVFRGFNGVVHNNSFIVTLNNNELDKDYLFVLLQSNFFRNQALSIAKNSVQPDLTHSMFKGILIPVPSKEEQKNIANVYLTLTSRINNNNKINAELESMAKTLYDYWFLQFDFPNENGKPYKSSGGRMVWSEELKREIPEGWTESTLSEISNMYQPNTFDAKLLEDDGKYRVYGAGGYMGQYHDFNHKESEIFISCRGSCGDIYRSMPFSLITGNAMIVHPNNIYLFEYLYLTLQRIGVKNCITGSVQPQITRTSLNDWKLVVPSEKVVRHFKSIVEPIFKKQETIIEENSKLNSLRDFLLPMLMNGQISFNK